MASLFRVLSIFLIIVIEMVVLLLISKLFILLSSLIKVIIICYIISNFLFIIKLYLNNYLNNYNLIIFTKILNNKYFHFYELILDSVFALKFINKYNIITFLIMLPLLPILSIILLIFIIITFIFMNNYIYTLFEAYLVKKKVVLKCTFFDNSSLFYKIIKLIECRAFITVYALLSAKKNIKKSFFGIFKNFLFFKIYGKSLIFLKFIYIVGKDVYCSLDYTLTSNKKKIAWLPIFIYDLKIKIKKRFNDLYNEVIRSVINKKIIIENRKIRLNQSSLTKWVIKNNLLIKNEILNTILENFNFSIPNIVNAPSSIKDNFVGIKLSNKIHLCTKISNFSDSRVLLKSFSTQNEISTSAGLFKKTFTIGQPLSLNYDEECYEVSKIQEKYSYYIQVNKFLLKKSEIPEIILNHYTQNNPFYQYFFELQEKIKLSNALIEKKIKVLEHDLSGRPGRALNQDAYLNYLNKDDKKKLLDLTEKIDSAVIETISRNLTIDKLELYESCEEVNWDLTIKELKNYYLNEFSLMPVTEFYDSCTTAFTTINAPNSYESGLMVAKIKDLHIH